MNRLRICSSILSFRGCVVLGCCLGSVESKVAQVTHTYSAFQKLDPRFCLMFWFNEKKKRSSLGSVLLLNGHEPVVVRTERGWDRSFLPPSPRKFTSPHPRPSGEGPANPITKPRAHWIFMALGTPWIHHCPGMPREILGLTLGQKQFRKLHSTCSSSSTIVLDLTTKNCEWSMSTDLHFPKAAIAISLSSRRRT